LVLKEKKLIFIFFKKWSSFEAFRTSVPPPYLGVDPAVPLSPGNE
jgi:hypothetical protein